MNKLRVCHISITSDLGGGPRHVGSLIEYGSDNIDFYLVCPNDGELFEFMMSPKVVGYLCIPNRRLSFRGLLKLVYFVYLNRFDIIHSHGFGAGVYGRLARLFFRKVRHVHTIHGLNESRIRRIPFRVYEFLSSGFNDYVVFVSESEKLRCYQLGLFKNVRSFIVLNGTPEIANLRFQSMERMWILTASRFDFQKNSKEICYIAERMPDLNFIILGDGPFRLDCIEYCKVSNVTNVTFVGNTLMVDYYFRKSIIYLNTSRWEGLSLAVLEAFSYGLPVVASKVVGNLDIINKGQNGYLYDLHNVDMAVRFIRKLVNDEDLRLSIGSRNIAEHKEKYSVRRMVSTTELIYFS